MLNISVQHIEALKLNSSNFDADFFSQLDMNFIKAEPDSDCETYPSYCQSENELIGRSDEQDPLFISRPVMKTENEVSFMYVRMFIVTQATLTFTPAYYLWCVHMKLLSGQMDLKESL
jgi:hypothetical protein